MRGSVVLADRPRGPNSSCGDSPVVGDTQVRTHGSKCIDRRQLKNGNSGLSVLGPRNEAMAVFPCSSKAKPALAGFALNAIDRGELAGEDAFSDEEDLGFFQGQVGRGQHQV